MAVDLGIGSLPTANGQIFAGQTAGIEVHVGNPPSVISNGAVSGSGINPAAPSDSNAVNATPVDATIGTSLSTRTSGSFNFGQTASMRFCNPA